jgi:hypothetical protein
LKRHKSTSGVWLRFYFVRASGIRCSVCGGVHSGNVLQIGLLLAAVISLMIFGLVYWQPGLKSYLKNRKDISLRRQLISHKNGFERRESKAFKTNSFASLQIPATAVIWNRTAAGSYLYETPGGQILMHIPNNTWVELLDVWSDKGTVPFGLAVVSHTEGWLDMRHVHRMPQPSTPVIQVKPLEGVFLYDRPGGQAGLWLSPGTPLLPHRSESSAGWHEINLLVGGLRGWLPSERLSEP